jgi:hypothetical protein
MNKHVSTAAGIIIIGAMALAGWWFVSRKTGIASPAAVLKSAVTAEPIPVMTKLRIEAGKGMTYTVSAPGNKVPGRLYGRWTSQGKTAGIKGATDDSLVGFRLVGPDNKVVEKSDHPSAGNFNLRFDAPGNYTFEFDNAGVVRSTARVVEFDGTYQPD